MCQYIGLRTGDICSVFRLDPPQCQLLALPLDVRNHSSAGLEWGYCGSGPAQLALAILLDVTRDREVAQALYQRYKFDVVATLPKAGFVLSRESVEEWITTQIYNMELECQNGATREVER